MKAPIYSLRRFPARLGIRGLLACAMMAWCLLPAIAIAQGSIFGVVQNSNLSNPGTTDLYWVGFLDNTDEEIRIETNTGAGYDGTNWFDDFQNYTTEVAGNPYDYFFINVTNGEAFHLEKNIPSNSFQQEDVVLTAAAFPSRPGGLVARVASSARINVSWNALPGEIGYHVYRRATANNGVFRRIDDPTGNLMNPGVSDTFFVDATSDGVTNYTYLIIAENAAGNLSAHSIEAPVATAIATAPIVTSVSPDSGSATGTPAVTVYGINFDIAGVTVTFGGSPATNVVVVSPFQLTCNVPTGTPGLVDVVATNTASGLPSPALVGGFRYLGNAAPFLAAIGAQAVDEGQILGFGASASDSDGDSLILSAVGVPANATFTDNFNGTGTFSFNPDFTQSGGYSVTIIVSDGALADTEIVAITVNHINLAPVLAAVGPQAVSEGGNLNVPVSASDFDADSLILTALGVPTNATFTDNFNGTGTFVFNPDFTQAGIYNVMFIVSDGALADSEVVTVTVGGTNLPPVLAAIGPQSVNEGQNLNVPISASDPDGDSLILIALNVPVNATFTDNFNGSGTFDFNPDFTQSGVYNVSVIVTDGALADTEVVAVTVNHVNLAPVLAAIGAQSVDEGQNLNVPVAASDFDADSLILTALNVPVNATFTDSFNGTGTFDFNPDFTQAGVYNVTIIVGDGALADTEIVAVTVNNIDRAPVLALIGSQTVDEGQNLTVPVSATDPDLDSLILTALNVPANATFTDNFNGTGTLDFNPNFAQSGVYNVSIIASDGALADTEIVAITVNHINLTPALALIGPQAVDEGQNLNVPVSASDADADSLILAALNVPVNATFTDNYDGTGTFDFNPDFTQSGVYNVSVIVNDGVLADTEIVAITVNHVNLTPVLTAIGPQSVNEGQNLSVPVSASDADADSLILTALNVPANATFTDNFNGTGTFDFNPDFTQSGIHLVTFVVNDGVLADSEVVAITVGSTNLVPVLAAIGPQTVNEGQNLNVPVSASDPDGDSLILIALNVPVNATFTDNFNGSGTFDFNPDFTQSGVYNVSVIVTDGALADTEIVAVTVNHVNLAPVLAAIGPQSVNEGQNLNVPVAASDFDADSLILTALNVPVNATFTDSFNGTGTFDFNPDFTQAGVYNVTIIVGDGALADTEIVAVTVNNIDRAPVLALIGSQTVDEGQSLTVPVSATDPDLDSLILSAVNMPANATFTDNFDGTGVFDFNPDFTQSGVHNVTFIVYDGAIADTEIVVITVNHINLAPALALIASQVVTEGQNLNFSVSASDFDGDSLILSALSVPVNATFTDNGNGTGVFNFNPDFTQAGGYAVTFVVSDGALADSQLVSIVVNTAGNQRPVLAAIGSKIVIEGQNLNFVISATDADSTTPALTAKSIPSNGSFVDNANGTGVFDFNPSFTQAGLYNVIFIASDGTAADSEIVQITVLESGNQAPAWNPIAPQTVDEGQTLILGMTATDPEGQPLTLSPRNVPLNAAFVDSGNGSGSMTFNPNFTQAGVYNVSFIASDGALADTSVVAITVNHVNLAPVLAAIGAQTVDEGLNLNVPVSGSDFDADSLVLSAVNLPLNATLTDNFDGTATLNFSPDFTQAGIYNVTVIVSDGALADSAVVAITVNHVNLAPSMALILPQVVAEGANLNFGVTATDADADSLVLSAESVPANATFVDNGNGTGTFDFNPDFTQAGLYNVTFIVTDGALADTQVASITVNDVGNQGPVLAAIGPQTVTEGLNLNVPISATDADGDSLILSALNVPANATFTDSFNGTGVFDFNPDFLQAGLYSVTFITSDGVLADTEVVAITVNDAGNQAPVLAVIGPQLVTESQNLNVPVVATDPDLDSLILSAINIPVNATFTDNFDGTGTFDFNPDFTQAGVYNVTIVASDGVLADSEVVAVTVNDGGNQAPVLAAIGPQTVDEGLNLNVPVTATDIDLDSLIFSAVNLPINATLTDNGNGSAVLDFNPDFTQSGVHNVTIVVSDGVLADSEVVAITVNQVNVAPILAAIGPQGVAEGANLNVPVSSSDLDGDSIILSAIGVPLNATFTDNFNGTGTFDFNPDFTQAGLYNVTFVATDGVLADTEIVAITVSEVGNQAPVLALIGAQVVDEGQALNLPITSSDADADSLILSALGVPANGTFADNFDGTGLFSFSPSFYQAGGYSVTFIVSDGVLADTEVVSITVNDVNQPPVLDLIPALSVIEGDTLLTLFTASDADSVIPAISAVGLPTGAVFADSGNGTASLYFVPQFDQSGIYPVWFIASDGVDADSQLVDLAVIDAGNQAPVLAAIGPHVLPEGDSLFLHITASDLDGDSLILTAVGLPLNATFVDSLTGAGGFAFRPDFNQGGSSYLVTFIVSDGIAADSEVVIVSVTDFGNLPPVFDPVAPQTVDEGDTLVILVHATDPEGTLLILGTQQSVTNAIFVDSGNGYGTLTYTPDFYQAGVDTVRILALDGGSPIASATLVIPITTVETNLAPNLIPSGNRTVLAGDSLKIRVVATDSTAPPGGKIFLTVLNLPANATFVDSGNGIGRFKFKPTFAQIGSYSVTFVATDNGTPALASVDPIVITVQSQNQAPVVAPISPKQVVEGASLVFAVTATDPDGTFPFLTVDSLPLNATFVDSGNGVGTFSWTPAYYQAGLYQVTFKASDGLLTHQRQVLIQVAEAGNQRPVLVPIGPIAVVERNILTLVIGAFDPDLQIPSLAIDTLITNATFVDSGNGTGVFTIQPYFDQDSVYSITFIADDGELADSEVVTLTIVDAGNQLPYFTDVDTLPVVQELGDLTVFVAVADSDLTVPSLLARPLPAFATFGDSGDGTGSFLFTPTRYDSGNYAFYLVATDADDALVQDSVLINLRVNDANLPPTVDSLSVAIPVVNVLPGGVASVTAYASDLDGTTPVLAVDSGFIASTMSFLDLGNGSGTLTFSPTFAQEGKTFFVRFVAIDGADPGILSTNRPLLSFKVNTRPVPPILDSIGQKNVVEGNTLQFFVTATDSNVVFPLPTVRAFDYPSNVTIDSSLNPGRILFTFTPGYTDAGVYHVLFQARDLGGLIDTERVAITVIEAGNRPPVWETVVPLDTIRHPVNQLDTLRLVASDGDDSLLTITAIGLPPNGSLNVWNNTTATFYFTPEALQVGNTYTVKFVVSDGVDADTAFVTYKIFTYKRGDLNADGAIDALDLAYLIDYVFFSGLPPQPVVEAGNVNGDPDGDVDSIDLSYLIDYVFFGGLPPPPE